MSNWNYIHGTITVSPMGRTQNEKRYILETVLQHLPIVYGSEEDMNVYIVQKAGYDMSSSSDEFGKRTNNLIDRHGYRSRRGTFRTQSEYILVVDGDLSDVTFSEVFRNLVVWLVRFSKRIRVKDVQIKIAGSGKRVLIDNRNNKWTMLYDSPSWVEKDSENWCEYLLWDYPRDKEGNLLIGKPIIVERKGQGFYY